jgi:Rrf2 family protein
VISLNRKTDYAMVALAELAVIAPERMSARKLADEIRVPLPVLTNVLHQLLRGGIVVSTRGSRGGYCLARAATEIKLSDIIEAVEGSFQLTMCCSDQDSFADDPNNQCDLRSSCRITEPLRKVHQSMRHFFDQIDLAYIAGGQRPVPLEITIPGQIRHEPMAGLTCEPVGVAGSEPNNLNVVRGANTQCPSH